MNELVFLGGRPLAHQETVRRGGRPVATHFNLGVGQITWPGDLLAYRKEWEPFIAAHLALWRNMNTLFENVNASGAQPKCPAGIFTEAQVQDLPPATREFCASLLLTRMYTSDADPSGILTQWNLWAGKSSAQVLADADVMLKEQQATVLRVGGPYKDDLLKLAKIWKLDVQLPDLPTFDTQQDILSQLEAAYVATKGALQLVGYGAGQTLVVAGDTAQAVAQGLSDTAKALPKVVGNPWVWIGVATAVAVTVGWWRDVYGSTPNPARKRI